MKDRLSCCVLSRRLALLLMSFLLWAALLCTLMLAGALPGQAGAALLCACVALHAAGGFGMVFLPLRHIEQALTGKKIPLDERLSQLANDASLKGHPLGRALAALENDIRTQYTAALLGKQAELDTLQSQINPHFLYNTLDSIRGQALHEGASDIADMTEALSTFFRYSISNRARVVTLEEELENVRNYFKIQQFRFHNRFHLSILPAAREDLEQCYLPKLTLQPIVENAILHGIEGKLGAGAIAIRIEGTARLVMVTVSDDGMGMNGETLLRMQARLRGEAVDAPHTGYGGLALPNVAQRIRLLFGNTCGVQLMSTPGIGTDVLLTLPRLREEDIPHGT